MSEAAIRFTLDWLKPWLAEPRRLLEVGCGEGALAAELQALGHTVVAIDASEDAVRAAKKKGVDARHADARSFEEAPFDLVVFTQSLHHVEDLKGTLEQSFKLLNPGGRLLAEEFAREQVDDEAAGWLYSRLDGNAKNALARWQESHGHPLHEGRAMEAAIHAQFDDVALSRGAYLFRYLGGEASALREELGAIVSGKLRPIGLRIQAVRPAN